MVPGLIIGLILGAGVVFLLIRPRISALRVALEHEQGRSEEKVALLEKPERDLTERFDALAAAALRNNNESFLELAAAKLGQKGKAGECLRAPLEEARGKGEG